jgi:hypothetical protein
MTPINRYVTINLFRSRQIDCRARYRVSRTVSTNPNTSSTNAISTARPGVMCSSVSSSHTAANAANTSSSLYFFHIAYAGFIVAAMDGVSCSTPTS